jgi:DNA-binding transcriptional ArsR family regulator
MDAAPPDEEAVAGIAAVIGVPARARMLYCLMDNHARTSTELAVVAGVSPSTASIHLSRLKTGRMVKLLVQGKHRYYSLESAEVAAVLEALSVVAGGSTTCFVPTAPKRLRAARTCYDHLAGTLGVQLHDRLRALGWLDRAYLLTPSGAQALDSMGIDIEAARKARRRFAFACLDWSERRSHLGGAMGAALLKLALKRRWVTQDLDSRALSVTTLGRREMIARFGVQL